MEGLVLEEKDAGDWAYRGEGACNLVLAYTGSSPSFMGKVMRVQKVPRRVGSPGSRCPTALSENERVLWKEIDGIDSCPNKEIAAQLYVEHVMSPLLGSKYVDSGMRVLVSREFLESIEKNILCERPAWRVDAAKVDTDCDSALLMSDHSLFPGTLKGVPCISVEIKPKCGFLPCSKFISEGNAVKRSITRFRMHQTLKLHQGEISELSEYNPLDLFSKSEGKIHKAINDLFTTPQNNFRVFLNGSLIFGGLGGGADSTNVVTSEAFEDALKPVIRADSGLRTKNFLQLVSETVYKSGILDQLLEVQKLDKFDIEGAIHAYYDIISESCPVCGELGEEEVSHRYTSLHSIPMDESLKIVKDYLVAATAKDCSLMISFRPRADGDLGSPYNVHLESTNQTFDYKASFIDLDLKPLKKMGKYYELDKKIVRCYTKMVVTKQEADEATSMEAYTTNKDKIKCHGG
ncbi:LOW QUALITY PROTEIN: inositol-pentakisphosphate 2-kinase-like [Quercus robur]|uniref:LOW QUALITY PROTEIN: inositol-pentakisphosphate 2-kinase-like n=1 Tax=Quercus robur TaxID=38942 RepID=UPI0021616272|nr:LOW QUALITY PROTEIN: inositol-pentakisphosphate 2-kinase-like [Quercus robur]